MINSTKHNAILTLMSGLVSTPQDTPTVPVIKFMSRPDKTSYSRSVYQGDEKECGLIQGN